MKFSFHERNASALRGVPVIRLTKDDKAVPRIVREEGGEYLEFPLGEKKEQTLRTYIILVRKIARTAKQHRLSRIAFDDSIFSFDELTKYSKAFLAERIAENLVMADFEFTQYKSKPKEGFPELKEVLFIGDFSLEMRKAFTCGQIIGETVNECRVLANTPGGLMTPRKLSEAAKKFNGKGGITVEVLGKKEMQKLGMGALLGVAQGSVNEPTFTIVSYNGTKPGKKAKPIVLAGKGITFDSGGLNLKPTSGIYEMHMDMSGAAAVLFAVVLASRLKVKQHVIALMPSAENSLSGESYRPGDILKSLSGKTIEVLNTDAEGRLVLADALTYAKRLNPSVVIDVATLTGAAITALGPHANAIMTRDDALAESLLLHAEESGDYAWRLPLWDEYESSIKGTFADLANVANGGSKGGGAIEGGIFLYQFAKELDAPWAHIDIAPRMTATPNEELGKGAQGSPVRLLLHFIESWKN